MILCVPTKTLTPQQKAAIAKKGFIIIECDDPDKIRVINPESDIDTNDYFMAALCAIRDKNPTNSSERFVYDLYERLKKKQELPKEEIIP